MTPHTNILLDTTGAAVTGASTGAWFAFQKDGRTHNVVSFTIVSGTGTVILEGRVGADSDPVQITSVTAGDAQLVAEFPQMRVRISGGTALVARVTVDRPGRAV